LGRAEEQMMITRTPRALSRSHQRRLWHLNYGNTHDFFPGLVLAYTVAHETLDRMRRRA